MSLRRCAHFPLAVTKLTAVVFPPLSPPPHIEGTPQQCQSSGQRRSLRTTRTLFLAPQPWTSQLPQRQVFHRHWARSTIFQRYINIVQAYTSGKDNPTNGVNRRRQRVTKVGRQEAERGGRHKALALTLQVLRTKMIAPTVRRGLRLLSK
ncbi:hypothetical protein B0H13DRAFT_2343577 [Mycena leptocephala]|nr:hypothetical protein B0H13DRAFT_2343577 [Mycena leptocephala]